jgi:glutamate synthase (NADPH/NADH) large chain
MHITILENLDHRGASGAEPNTGDGAGIMIQIPHEFLFDECLKTGFQLCLLMAITMASVMLFMPKEIKIKRRVS